MTLHKDLHTDKKGISIFIVEFVIFSLIGWIYETVYTSVSWGEFADRGFLHIPICPIYGFFSFSIISIFNNRKANIPVIFIVSTLIVGVLEYLSSYLIEIIFHISLWDYSYMKYDINGRVSVIICLFFGAACVLLVKLLHPKMNGLLTKLLSEKAAKITAVVLILIIIADTIICSVQTFA